MPFILPFSKLIADAKVPAKPEITAALASRPDVSRHLLAWYDREGRNLPWREKAGQPDPYRVWLSEIMLQQTTVRAVKAYFEDFTRRWPSVEALAQAPEDEIMAAWAGLGYYSRARNLIKAARLVAREHGGRFPDSEEGLRALPGIGPYTAAAIAAIAFDRPAVVVDGNVERVVARLFAIKTPLPEAKGEIRARAGELTPDRRPGDFAQAMMDLGATICTPRRPACVLCPLRADCAAAREGEPTRYPLKAARPARPVRRGHAYVAVRPDGSVLLERRPPKGLLGGMAGVPHSPWVEGEPPGRAEMTRHAPLDALWRKAGVARHGFTHFELEMQVQVARVRYGEKLTRAVADRSMFWHDWGELEAAGLPTAFRKVIAVAAEKLELPPPKARRARG